MFSKKSTFFISLADKTSKSTISCNRFYKKFWGFKHAVIQVNDSMNHIFIILKMCITKVLAKNFSEGKPLAEFSCFIVLKEDQNVGLLAF